MSVLLKTKELQKCIIRNLLIDNNIRITPVQCQIINYLINNKCAYQKDIENVLKLRRSTISGVLHTMEKNGLIKKEISKDDSRLKKIILTENAIQLHDNINLKFDKLNEDMCKDISKEEIEVFLNIIDKMIENIRK